MNKVEELIEKFCPEGVEYKTLGEVCEFQNGFAFKSSLFKQQGFAIIRITNIHDNIVDFNDLKYFDSDDYDTDLTPFQINKNDILVAMSGATTGKFGLSAYEGKAFLNQRVGKFKPNLNILLNKYLFHFLLTKSNEVYLMAGGGAQPNLSSNELMSKISIPIPPLPIQEAIVKILDNFSSLTAELQAELQARKSQYEFYRNQLLTFDREDADPSGFQSDGSASSLKESKHLNTTNTQGNPRVTTTIRKPRKVKWMRLGDACFLKSGKGIPASEINDTKDNINRFECYGANGLRGYVNHYSNDGFFPIIGRQGALCGNVCFASGKFYATEHAVLVSNKENFNSRFLFHLLTKMDLNQYKSQGAQPGLSVEKLNELSIPIPSIEEQERIAKILDRFDTLINDISTGLPAEITARQQQYEYYRDKLLTFKRKEA